ncbi:hypothetical protein OIE63_15275 [Streptomyces sp. NBC_01795]|uniref:hypothetical protein n=1 Tax=unclassified Streptomyces TaxID=2593676 RepID=UPI002DDBD5B0|nr:MULTISPECIES: hypothetical protein [unclassified Streptomyces]WSA92771.1 hypothetical protein OIE63_15275 [Streptomyces sp. NBC_01795]WSB77142.1 hypothetical protein OHB04_16110 [Streptomyces sp. NBC_01775]WSS14593.1 hypothetical protein OG533_23865 [Streptomyces sp. NBC_01186]
MKQVAKKTLGAAAISAVAVVAGAGAASAAPVDALVGPVTETATGTVAKLPVGEATQGLPGGTSQTLASTHKAVSGALTGSPTSLNESLTAAAKEKNKAPGGGMIGGLPVTKGLPLGG